MPTQVEQRFGKLAAYAQALWPLLDKYNYYQLLELTEAADAGAVRTAFYKMAAHLHPDRYHDVGEAETRDRLHAIYARVCEGYRVLSNPERRATYDKGLKQGRVRFVATDRERKGPSSPEDAITHPEAKKFYRLAAMAMSRKDWKGAVMNFKFAKNFAPDSEIILEQLMAAEVALKGFGK